MLAALMVLTGIDAKAEAKTNLTLGPVYFDGKDDYGPDPGEGSANNDWSGARDGNGVKFAVRHAWERLYIAAEGEWLDVRHRSDRIRPICALFPMQPVPRPPYDQCRRGDAFFDFEDEYRAAYIAVGLTQAISGSWSMWGQLGVTYQRWSSSGGSATLTPPSAFVTELESSRHSESAWTAAAGVVRRSERLSLELGINYQPEGYFPSYDLFVPFEPLGSSSLLEGIARADWYFTPRWFGRLEYRPSRQRQYLHAGLGIAF
jgi:hypothetical protein